MPRWCDHRRAQCTGGSVVAVTSRQLLSLAAIFQAAALAKSLATTGRCDSAPLAASIRSVLITDAERFEEIFSSPADLRIGLVAIRDLMTSRSEPSGRQKNVDLMRYTTSLMALERKYQRRNDLQRLLADGLEALQVHQHTLGVAEPPMIKRLGQLYLETLSTIKPPIMVAGHPTYLQQEQLVCGIRTALLCGVRAASLWRSEGGSMWRLVLQWKTIVRMARQALDSIPDPQA